MQAEESLYEWRKRMGLCVKCGKEKPFAGYVHCAECIEKVEEASRKCWADPEKRIRYNKHGNERKKELIRERKENGLCPRCGRPIKSGTYIYCKQCREKKNAARRTQNSRRPGDHFKERIAAGVCMYCGEEVVPGYKLCETCLNRTRDNFRKANERSFRRWRKEITAGWKNAKRKNSVNG